jgi:DNA (cytosine-5)-methyltransferase 1
MCWTATALIYDDLKMATKRSIISLFSGAMGLDLGLEAAGFKTAVALEKNKMAVETIRLNKGDNFPLIDRPIEDVPSEELLKLANLAPREAFVLTGGPCCQSFSTAGTRKSLSDESRGTLFRHFKRIVSEAKPRFFVMENVKGMLSAAVRHRPLDERGPGFPPLAPDEELGSALRIIREELADLNYRVIFGLVNCADYGVPQKRRRIIFIGSRDGEEIRLPAPTHCQTATEEKLPWMTLKQAIQDLKGKQEFVNFAEDRKELLAQLKAGENWTHLPKQLHRKALGGAADTWGGRTGFCRRLAWDSPSPTLTTDPIGRATTLCHPTKLRPLSVQEYARLQQFPDGWEFAGSNTQKYMQIGNAVPLGLGTAIGKVLKEVAALTDKTGLPADASSHLGKVIPAEQQLEVWLKGRRKTQLHPPWRRKSGDPLAAKKWLEQVGA